jgi:phosphoribosylformylglycinamidine cyclo-ligase
MCGRKRVGVAGGREMNLSKYLARIGVDGADLRPDVETLRLLQLRHLMNVPFENLDIHWHRPITLDTGRFYKKIVEEGRGGFCYELNGLFNELLTSVGFRTHLVSGRVFGPDRVPGPDFDHMAVLVHMGGEEYLADVGFGDFISGPLRIDPSAEQTDREGTFIIRLTEHGAFEVEKKAADGWAPECLFGRAAHALEDFAAMCEFHQSSPDSHFTKGKLCSILTANGRKTLTDTKFVVTSAGAKVETAVDSPEKFDEILAREFSIEKEKSMTRSISYADAGVSIDNANVAVAKIREMARSTFNERTLTEIGSFGGMFAGAFPDMAEPILVASADGVGTKLKLAFETGRHNTVGADLVNHCVNDILVQGARPLFFLDYFATGRLEPDVTASVVEGMARACRENGCVLLGGETAEMPDFYPPGEYDLAGFIVGVVDKQRVIDGKSIAPGDVVLGLPSTGLQTNGYSLARKLFFEVGGYKPDTYIDELGAMVGDALLATHASFLRPLEGLLDKAVIKGLVHITGGSFTENIPRILPEGVAVEIKRGTWPELPIFGMMQHLGNVEDAEMFRTFNMGIGMVVICAEDNYRSVMDHLHDCCQIGRVVAGANEVSIL